MHWTIKAINLVFLVDFLGAYLNATLASEKEDPRNA